MESHVRRLEMAYALFASDILKARLADPPETAGLRRVGQPRICFGGKS
jgi:hypothetical protein